MKGSKNKEKQWHISDNNMNDKGHIDRVNDNFWQINTWFRNNCNKINNLKIDRHQGKYESNKTKDRKVFRTLRLIDIYNGYLKLECACYLRLE